MTRMRNRTSRRAPPLQDSDYDHEIRLINNEDHPAAVVVDEPRPVPPLPAVTVTSSGQLAQDHVAESALALTRPTSTSTSTPPPPPPRKLRPSVGLGAAAASVAAAATGLGVAAAVTAEPTSAIDILYENERGGFLCGMPMFSSRALGNLDPPPWTNAAGKTSPTDIYTAQVPDPSWQWAWPAWRINHDTGTNEGGWEYSFMFAKVFSWHGPTWYSSFVRRRVWLRKRVKRSVTVAEAATTASLTIPTRTATPVSGDGASTADMDMDGNGAVMDPHMLNPDYFVVLPAAEIRRSSSRASGTSRVSRVSRTSRSSAHLYPAANGQRDGTADDDEDDDEREPLSDEDGPAMPAEIDSADMLLGFLYDARIDREKIEAVDNFIEHAGEDLVRLQDIMHQVMAQFVFQAPRRLLLSHLKAAYKEAVAAKQAEEERGKEKGKEPASAENGTAADTSATDEAHRLQALGRRVGYLAAAVRHADEEVRRLEYWSDVKAMAKNRPSESPVGTVV